MQRERLEEMNKDKYYTFNNYMNENDLSATEEDYIEMIYRLCQSNDHQTRVMDIARVLHVKPPSVTKMVKKLKDLNIVDYKRYGCIRLTEGGIKTGKFLVHRHNAVKSFLTLLDVQGDLHEDTEKIEHTISENTLKRIEKLVYFFQSKPEVLNELISIKDFDVSKKTNLISNFD